MTPITPPPDLWPHQQRAVDWVRRTGSGMLHVAMGGGKTRIAIESAIAGAARALIVAPLAVIPAWEAELARWGPPGLRIIRLDRDTTARRAEALAQWLRDDRPGAAIANYDAIWRGDLGRTALLANWDAIILDESQRAKSPSGRAARWLRDLRRRHPRARVLALTGTPMPHGPLDIWAQMQAVRPDVVPRTFTEFRRRHVLQGPLGPWHVVGYRNLDRLAADIAPAVFRVDAAELTRPDSVVVDVPVELEPHAMRIYRQLATRFAADLDAGRLVSVTSRLTQLLRMQQLTGGRIPADDGSVIDVSTAKRAALRELIEDLPPDEPIVVFGVFHADLDAVHAVAADLGTTSAELSGRVNQLAEWQAPDGPRILAVQVRAGSVGVSMVRAAYAVFYSIGYGLGDYEQSLARLVRPGQDRPVTFYRLIAAGTVDHHVARALAAKADVVEFVSAAIREASQCAPSAAP